jgi:hypothetical protein
MIRESRGRGIGEIGAWVSYGVVAAAATGLLRGPLRFRPLRGPAAPPYTSLDLARSTPLKDLDDRPRCEQSLRKRRGVSFQKRIDVRLASDVASMPSPACQKSVPRFSQRGQTINVRAVNARALA